ncbi:MAG: hypothetical protein ACREFC_15040 [Stellaceae bacterium]
MDEDDERQVMCSGCGAIVPEGEIHVIPHFNETVLGYVTTFRCLRCWHDGLAVTRSRLAAADRDELASLAGFFERYGYIVNEARRGDPPDRVRPILTHLIGMLESGAIRLAIGPAA